MRVYGVCLLAVIGLAALLIAKSNYNGKTNRARVELGRKLFFDPGLSASGAFSCATCHQPQKAFTNGARVAVGVHGQSGERNVPTLLNRAHSQAQFWDMRARSLEAQAEEVMQNPIEMGGTAEKITAYLRGDADYAREFRNIFGQDPDLNLAAHALSAFERTLRAGSAPYDRYVNGDLGALTEAQVRGKNLFFNEFKCAGCHTPPNFTDEKLNVRCYPFQPNLQIRPGPRLKTPTLRNLIYTAPYMHNGEIETLEGAVEFYNPSLHLGSDGKPHPSNTNPIYINEEQKKDLVEFLKSLSADTPFTEEY